MDRNPQAEQMRHESMARGLAAQAAAIWPQERSILLRHGLLPGGRILDVACGTGEFTARAAALFEKAEVVGVDIEETLLQSARKRSLGVGERVSYRRGDAFDLPFEADEFDLTVSRHFLQIVPDPSRVLGEMMRVTRPGGRLHVLAEDYGMIFLHPMERDGDRFWREGPIAFGRTTGTDLRIGRKAWTLVTELGLREVTVDYVVVDTVRVPREDFLAIWKAWRDGYTEVIAHHTELELDEVRGYWEEMIGCLENPQGYAAWLIPLVAGVVP